MSKTSYKFRKTGKVQSMKAVMDTSSLLAFVNYYLPFDKSGKLKAFFKEKFDNGDIIVIDRIHDEAKLLQKGIILNELEFLAKKSDLTKTTELLPPRSFFNLVENQFCNKQLVKLKGLTDAEFESEKTKFLNGVDANLVLYAQQNPHLNPVVVTEESAYANDNKVFKKIPANCQVTGIKCCTLPELFTNHFGVNIQDLL